MRIKIELEFDENDLGPKADRVTRATLPKRITLPIAAMHTTSLGEVPRQAEVLQTFCTTSALLPLSPAVVPM